MSGALPRWDLTSQLTPSPLAQARSAQREASLVRAQLQHLSEVRRLLPVLRSRSELTTSSAQTLTGNPSSSTANLERGVRLHGTFSKRYLGYAAKDGREALRQAEMAGRYAFEVGARRLLASGEPEQVGRDSPGRRSPSFRSTVRP